MRVALLSYRSRPHCGGQGVYVANVSRELVRLGHSVEVLSGPPYPELDPGVTLTRVESLDLYREPDPFRTPGRAEFRDATDVLEYVTMRVGGFGEPRSFCARAARILWARRGDFDVVLDNQSLGPGLLLLPRTLPLVAMIHHPISVDRRVEIAAAPDADRRASLARWYRFVRMQARVARRLPDIVTVSASSADDIVRDFRVPRERIRVVPVGVDPAVFSPAAAPARVPGRLVCVASADTPMKGVLVLLEALAKLRTERDAHLVLVGAPLSPATRARVAELGLPAGAVRVTGGLDRAELAATYASAEAAVIPSLYEGFSLPAVEAMACGTPIVASRAGALPEVVGPAGVLVAPGDAGALAAALRALLDNPAARAHLSAAGRARVAERFTWARVGAATAEHLGRAVERAAAERAAEPAARRGRRC